MKPYFERDGAAIHLGDCLTVLPTFAANSADAIATDPPYEIGFMGRSWDRSGIANNVEMWREVLRVLKPGGYLLSFGGTRTYHRMACAVEDAGFSIKDSIDWLYGSGFPKSINLGDGLGTALKPGHEPIVLAQKPLQGTYAANLARWGVGALNIDACRVAAPDGVPQFSRLGEASRNAYRDGLNGSNRTGEIDTQTGRWPANVVLDEDAAAELDAQTGTLTSGTGSIRRVSGTGYRPNALGAESRPVGTPCIEYGDSGGASRFFYVAKAAQSERNKGLDGLRVASAGEMTLRKKGSAGLNSPRAGAGRTTGGANVHPTVKPLTLMRWLVRLVTPADGLVLDPFAGSGTTGVACTHEGVRFIGIELSPEYCEIAARRLSQMVLPFAAGG
jgi:site-specific DNA-methyltransferase (adenine-specific)